MILKHKITGTLALVVFAASLVSVTAAAQPAHSEAHRAAFEECREQLGLEKPVAGQRPTALDDDTRAQLDACLKEKGFEPPKFGRKGPRGDKRPAAAEESSGSGVQ